MADKRPALVARPTTTAEVVEAVGYAREHDLPLSCAVAGTTSPGRRSPTAG